MSDQNLAKEPTLGRWIEQDHRKPSEAYAAQSRLDLGTDDIEISRYTSREFHEKEVSGLWSKTWQMACHESEIPDVGDFVTYEIGLKSFIVVRSAADEIRAFSNSCLHRGTELASGCGHVTAFTCRFHGWAWNIDGSLRNLPERWDFPQTQKRDMCLPQARTAIWGGFVFINPDPRAQDFDQYCSPLTDHFKSAPLENRKIAYHVSRVMPANWKVAQEAFMESYHVMPTHPQSVGVSEYAETQYDIYSDNVSRLATISVAPVAPAMKALSEQEFADYAAKGTGREPITVPEGQTYRNALAQQRRDDVFAASGQDVSHLADVEMLDAVEYFLFPNFLPWHGFGLPIVYRFRPNGDDHRTSIMDVYLLAPRRLDEPCPPAPAVTVLPPDRPFAEDPGLGRLGVIFDQDFENIAGVWKGLQSAQGRGLILGQYQESRIRHYHRRIDDFVGE